MTPAETARIYAWLRCGRRAAPPKPKGRTQHHLSFELTPDRTNRLRARRGRVAVSVQSAICTAFLPGFSAIHTPVNLRVRLARVVGESVGLFVGAAEVKMTTGPPPAAMGSTEPASEGG